jgi:hypothetical protein
MKRITRFLILFILLAVLWLSIVFKSISIPVSQRVEHIIRAVVNLSLSFIFTGIYSVQFCFLFNH